MDKGGVHDKVLVVMHKLLMSPSHEYLLYMHKERSGEFLSIPRRAS